MNLNMWAEMTREDAAVPQKHTVIPIFLMPSVFWLRSYFDRSGSKGGEGNMGESDIFRAKRLYSLN